MQDKCLYLYERNLICLQDVCHDITERTLLKLIFTKKLLT